MSPGSRRATVVLAIATLTGGLTACGSDDKPDATDFKACALVDATTASAALGAASVTSDDESKDMNGPESNILSCRYTPKGEGPALVFFASQASSSSKATNDVESTQQSCADAQPLAVDGVTGFVCSTGDLGGGPQVYATWDTYVVHAALTQSRTGPDAQKATVGLTSVIEQIHDNLTATAFTGS